MHVRKSLQTIFLTKKVLLNPANNLLQNTQLYVFGFENLLFHVFQISKNNIYILNCVVRAEQNIVHVGQK